MLKILVLACIYLCIFNASTNAQFDGIATFFSNLFGQSSIPVYGPNGVLTSTAANNNNGNNVVGYTGYGGSVGAGASGNGNNGGYGGYGSTDNGANNGNNGGGFFGLFGGNQRNAAGYGTDCSCNCDFV